VINSRIVPNIVDGLIPVQRRIMIGIYLNGSSTFDKAAMHVGYVLGNLHPHSDLAVYDSMVRLTQNWIMPIPFIDSHGNNGSISGSDNAAMRYLEVKLSNFSKDVFFDETYLNENIIDYEWNYNHKKFIPSVLPSKIPTIFLNNLSTIGTGFTCNLPPHNLNEICDATLFALNNPNATTSDLLKYIKGIDSLVPFTITNASEIESIYTNGTGTFSLQGNIDIEKIGGKECLVITSLPQNITTQRVLESITELSKDKDIKKRIEAGPLFNKISSVKDLSEKLNLRIAIFPKRDVSLEVLKHLILKHTPVTNHLNYIANVITPQYKFVPEIPLHEIIHSWIQNRIVIVRRKFINLVSKNLETITIIKALIKANKNIDAILKLIKTVKDKEELKEKLINLYDFADKEAEYVVNQPLYKITSSEISKLNVDLSEKEAKLKEYMDIVNDDSNIIDYIRKEITDIKNKYGKKIVRQVGFANTSTKGAEGIINSIESNDILVTFTNDNYIYSTEISDIKNTSRNTKGKNVIDSKRNKTIVKSIVLNTHDRLLCFSNNGRMFILYGYQLNVNNVHINNIIGALGTNRIVSMIKVEKNYNKENTLILTTADSFNKRCLLDDYITTIREDGLIAIGLNDGDELVDVVMSTNEEDLIIINTKGGYSSKIPVNNLSIQGRVTKGNRKIRLKEGDKVTSTLLVDAKRNLNDDAKVALITTNGKGKLVEVKDLLFKRTETGRGAAFLAIKLNKEDSLVRSVVVYGNEELIINTLHGRMVKLDVNNVNTYQRLAKGNSLIKLNDGDSVVSLVTNETSKPI
jgi:DNA gyrase subunit A